MAIVRGEKQADGRWTFDGATCETAGPPVVTVAAVREQVSRLVPVAVVGVAPRVRTLVNIETIMWVGGPVRRVLPAVSIVGQGVVITIDFDHVEWDFGDGVVARVSDPGRPYSVGDPCSTQICPQYSGHVYARTGAMAVSARVFWRASFRVGGGAVVTIPGVVAGPVGRSTVQVVQARGVLVSGPRR